LISILLTVCDFQIVIFIPVSQTNSQSFSRKGIYLKHLDVAF